MAAVLLWDGITSGAVYALLAMAIVLVFSVTRVIFLQQGEFVAFGALTLAMLQQGQVPGTVWLLLALAGVAAAMDVLAALRAQRTVWNAAGSAARQLVLPVSVSLLAAWLAPMRAPLIVQALLTLALVTPLGSLTYRIAYRSLANASVLLLLIVSVGVHFALSGLALAFFGAEGFQTPSFWDLRLSLGALTINGQALVVFFVTVAIVIGLFLFFEKTLTGKALRATAVNRKGARLMGISSDLAGSLSFTLASFIGALSGLLIGPTMTMFYDSGFLIGLKGFVAAVFAGLASFPGALAGAVMLGVLEAFGSFWASAFKEVIVFTAILPVLLWRSLTDSHLGEH